jgi:hypothetical protein
VEAVAMFTVTARLATRLVPLVAGALFCAGCTSGGSPSTAEASPTATPTATPERTATATPTPTSAERKPLTSRELPWLQAVEQLPPTMEKVFKNAPTYMTTRAMRSMAYKLRGCSRELARVGRAPSARLQPVEALVRKGCQEYDKGATCFEDAARIGAPLSGSSEERKFDQKLQCGFNASGTGSEPLADAANKAEEVRAAAAGSG